MKELLRDYWFRLLCLAVGAALAYHATDRGRYQVSGSAAFDTMTGLAYNVTLKPAK